MITKKEIIAIGFVEVCICKYKGRMTDKIFTITCKRIHKGNLIEPYIGYKDIKEPIESLEDISTFIRGQMTKWERVKSLLNEILSW